VAQVGELQVKALNSNSSTTKKKKKDQCN
jgi:hypothetical protein